MDGASLDKLRKICGLLGSEHDGERATAARMASALLQKSGVAWNAISFNGGASSSVSDGNYMAQYLQMMLNDERARTKRLSSDLDKMKRQVKTLELRLAERETGIPVAEQRKREKAEKDDAKAERLREKQAAADNAAANQRSAMPIDAELRERIAEALSRPLPDRTREFLASVKDQKAWTFKQREAIKKTLSWVFRGGE